MEEHTRLLEALCRIFVKKIKTEERKEDVAKYADEIKKIWGLCVSGFTEYAPQIYLNPT